LRSTRATVCNAPLDYFRILKDGHKYKVMVTDVLISFPYYKLNEGQKLQLDTRLKAILLQFLEGCPSCTAKGLHMEVSPIRGL
jgi:hypothetical protein